MELNGDASIPPMTMSDTEELSALRQAVTMMGFDPAKLAAFAAADRDYQCRSTLLFCVGLDVELLKLMGASSLDAWQEYYARLLLDSVKPLKLRARSVPA